LRLAVWVDAVASVAARKLTPEGGGQYESH
jgi:hypothetical protein